MESSPLVSVIVPVYCAQEYLDRCVRSLMGQTHSNLQIILIDDGSTDESGRMCDAYAAEDKRITALHQPNRGPSAARNFGLDMACGDWIGFVDSDDWVAPDMYEKLLSAAAKMDADIACGQVIPVQSHDRQETSASMEQEPELWSKADFWRTFFRIGTQECVFYVWNRIYSRDTWGDLRFPEDTCDGEDAEVTFNVFLCAERVVRTDLARYYYYQNKKGLTLGRFSPGQLSLRSVWDRIEDKCNADALDLLQWAQINRARTDFTLLMRIVLSADGTVDQQCVDVEREMLAGMKKNYRTLLCAQIPFDRKVAITAMVMHYPLFKRCVRGAKRLRQG